MSRRMFLRFGLDSQPSKPKNRRRTWKPSSEANWVRMIDGKYDIGGEVCQGFPFTMHYVGKGRSGGFFLTHRDDETCVPCYQVMKGAQNISVSRKVLMTAFWPGWFHLVDKQGEHGAYKQKELCLKPHMFCKHCETGDEPTYGRRLPWGMTSGDADILMDRAMEIAKMCKQCGGDIFPLSVVCDSCGHTFYDLTRMSMEHKDIMIIMDEKRTCPGCKTHSYASELLKCSNDCTLPARSSIFDVLLKVKTVKTGANSYAQLAIVEHSKPVTLEEILHRDNAEGAFKDYHVEPVDPGTYTDPESAEEQAAKLGCPNPYSNKPQPKPPTPPERYES